MSPKLRAETWKWFGILKTIEIVGTAVATVGAYFYGVLFYWLLGWPLPNWFLTWLTGLNFAAMSVGLLIIIYALGNKWLSANWCWAQSIAKQKLKRK